MYIFNVRKGFATNSSSSHSVIEIKPKDGKYDVLTDEYTDFGWEFFTVHDSSAKKNYLISTIRTNLNELKFSGKKTNEFLINFFTQEEIDNAKEAYIDHQSVITIPRNWDNKSLNIEFLKDFISYVLSEKVAILGGNDNTDQEHPLFEEDSSQANPVNQLNKESSHNHYIARKDKDYWTIFNRENGEKVRFSFTNPNKPTKAFAPELADIKITDFCPYDCDFCYQDSTLEGKHASFKNIKTIINELAKNQTLEIAYGGGETTLHPQFVEILKYTKKKNIVPNFTTKNLNLLRQSNAKDIVEHCGAMAFSIESKDDMLKVKSSLMDFEYKNNITSTGYSWSNNHDKKTSPWNPKITFQVVLGTMPIEEFKDIINFSANFGAKITLLGYKENGRGSSFAPYNYDEWLDIVSEFKDKNYLPISIDTALAGEFEKELLIKNIDPTTFHTNEGAFSVYIDAVKMKFYPSSYIGLEQGSNFNQQWLEDYSKMNISASSTKKTIKIKS